jgi:cytosine deaminase
VGPGFFTPPQGGTYTLRRVRAPACLIDGAPGVPDRHGIADFDLRIANGRIDDIAPAGSTDAASGPDLDRSLVLPGLIDCHTHLDKGHIWPRTPNPTGDVPGAVTATMADRTKFWNAEDVRARMEFGLETAYAKGSVAIRTHLDSLAPQASISFPVFKAVREAWASRITMQVSSIAPPDIFLTDEGRQLADIVADANGNLGCGSRMVGVPNDPVPPEFDEAITRLFKLAAERGIDVDLHVDESTDPAARALIRIAQAAVRVGFKGNILCGHCSSLALQTDEFIRETIDACRDAGIDIVSLPPVNMYLQDRVEGRTPRWRGVTLLHEMKAAGLRVAVAGDNCRDPFYAYGDHDMLETFTNAVRILHLDHPFGDWIASAFTTPAAIMKLPGFGILKRGATADLIVLKARSYSEMLARHQFDRVVIRGGKQIDTTLPDYRRLDSIVGW